ncbi:hypothetical protein [Legionella spiritensis]|uniref:Uncharacterized protein n=1 Tax=Legionella spiritensis TaxID=452 RepID=A0A0W0YWW0_LEGSP|nr:hypothetical protein [Legionella spiritensis]KTD61167.1 hypothetical protein Lspi_2787 [Legionella spiritensis]SNV45333.1 Uncharacterised protein [Legionella spiritensis]
MLPNGGIFSEAQHEKSTSVLSSSLFSVNDQFLKEHQSASATALQGIMTVMVFHGGNLSLWVNDKKTGFQQREYQTISGDEYHQLKSVCHIPVILLDQIKSGRISRETLADLGSKLTNVLKALPVLPETVHSNAVAIVEQSTQCINRLQDISNLRLEEKIIGEILRDYQYAIKDNIAFLSAAATGKQLSALHDVTQKWLQEYGIDLSQNRVLLVGAHGPRKGFIEMQYFLRLYTCDSAYAETPVKNNYVYYIEMLPCHMAELDIKARLIDEFLAHEEQNKQVADWLLGEPLAMQQDVLRKDGPDIIAQLLPEKEQPEPMKKIAV